MLIRRASLLDGRLVDVRCRQGLILALADRLSAEPDEDIVEAGGGVLLPGLHDHHIHLFALAAARASVSCGPPDVHSARQLRDALAEFRGGATWIRGVGYHESVAGHLTRQLLDSWVADRPVRIQHRSGKMWFLNSRALASLALDGEPDLEGVERDGSGRATGRLFRLDEWLGRQLARESALDLAVVSNLLAGFGVTGVTDASASNGLAAMLALEEAVAQRQLLQRVLVMGTESLPVSAHALLDRGALKILLDDHCLPTWDELLARIGTARAQRRPVALHCVTRTELVFALAALGAAGRGVGDRIEHASVAPDEAFPLMRETGIVVVTQPGFIYQRGDQYALDVAPEEQSLLYRCRGFVDAGIPLAGSSDAPYGDPDPWLAMRAAVHRSSSGGLRLGEREALSPERALQLFTTRAECPGAAARIIGPGEPADLCLLDRPWALARMRLDSSDVLATIRGGELIYRRPVSS